MLKIEVNSSYKIAPLDNAAQFSHGSPVVKDQVKWGNDLTN